MKKVLSLVLALVLVLGMIPTFAAGETGAELLFEHEFIYGDENGDLMVEKVLTRDEMAVLFAQMYGKQVEAAAFVAPANFTDAATFGWAANYISFAQASEWVVGYPDGTYQPKNVVTGKELLSAMMQVLGYEFTWETIVADAAAVGLTVSTEGPILRGAAFETLWIGVSAININGEEMTIGEKTGKIEPPAPVVTDLEVAGITFDNLKTFTVMFNQEVDKDTVEDSVVVTKGSSDLDLEVTLKDDMKTLVVVLDGQLLQSDSVKITVEDVETVAGEVLVAYEATMVVNDVTVPSAINAIALNPKQLELTFSEPVQMSQTLFSLWNDIKIDGTAVVAKATPDYANNSVLLTFSTALSEGSHSVELKNVKDFANFTAPATTLAFTVVKDDAAPVATGITVKSNSTIVVKFNEPVLTKGEFKVDNIDRTATTTFNDLNTEATITGLNLGVSAIVEIKVEYKGQKDIMGNEVKEWTTIITNVADDTSLPTVELTTVGTGNKLTLTFSKPMTPNMGKIELYDKDNVKKETVNVTTFKSNSDDKVLEVTFTTLASVNPGDYSIKVLEMKDATIRNNALPTTTIAFVAKDSKKPSVEAFYLTAQGKDSNGTINSDKDTIKIYFSEAMDVATIENLANYYVAGVPMTADSMAVSAKASADAKSVVITYKTAYTSEPTVTVFAVKDAAGNMMLPLTGQVVNVQTNTALTYASAKAVDKNTVEVTFSAPIVSVDPSLIVLHDGTQVVTNFVSATVKSTDTKVVVFKTATAMETDPSGYNLRVATPSAIKNVYNVGLTTNGVDAYATNAVLEASITDEIKPELESIAAHTTAGQIKLVFSEEVEVTLANLDSDLIVKDENGVVLATPTLAFYLNGVVADETGFDTLYLVLTAETEYSVELVARYVTDTSAAANVITTLAAKTITTK